MVGLQKPLSLKRTESSSLQDSFISSTDKNDANVFTFARQPKGACEYIAMLKLLALPLALQKASLP